MTSPKRAPMLAFSAGGTRFAVFVVEIARLLVEEVIAPVPFSHPAMAGLLLVDEGASFVPVFDVQGLIDPMRSLRRKRGGTVALFPTEQGPVGLRLDTVDGTIEDYEPVSPEGAALFLSLIPDEVRRVTTGVALREGAPLYFFSPEGLLVELGLLKAVS